MNDAALQRGAADQRMAARRDLPAAHERVLVVIEAVLRRQAVVTVLAPEDQRSIRLAEARGGCDESVEHGLQFERRATHDLQHVSRGDHRLVVVLRPR